MLQCKIHTQMLYGEGVSTFSSGNSVYCAPILSPAPEGVKLAFKRSKPVRKHFCQQSLEWFGEQAWKWLTWACIVLEVCGIWCSTVTKCSCGHKNFVMSNWGWAVQLYWWDCNYWGSTVITGLSLQQVLQDNSYIHLACKIEKVWIVESQLHSRQSCQFVL